METLMNLAIEWGVAIWKLPGEVESGDRHLVKPFPNGVLVAVVDGLGHGAEAAAAATIAASTMEHYAHESVISLLRRCDERLRTTRGAAVSVASFNTVDKTITWLSVGNVAGVLIHADPDVDHPKEFLVLRGGVVGGQLPPLRAMVIPLVRGDTLILATDGIRSDFAQGLTPVGTPQQIANRILAECRKGTDDALVLVARYLGGAS